MDLDHSEKLAVAVFWDETAWVAVDARHNIAAQGDTIEECLHRFAQTVGAELHLKEKHPEGISGFAGTGPSKDPVVWAVLEKP